MENNNYDTRVKELPDGLYLSIEKEITDLKQKQNEVRKAKEKILAIISQHNNKRFELLLERWRRAGLGWCTNCHQVVMAKELELVLTWGNEYRCSSHHEGGYGYPSFKRLHRTCAVCRQKLLAENGSYGKWDDSVKEQTSFFACKVSADHQLVNNQLANNLGLEDFSIKKHPNIINSKLEAEWNIPPEIVINEGNFHVSGTGVPPFAKAEVY